MKRPSIAATLAVLLSSGALVVPAFADERIEGIVQRTKITHCEAPKAGGCTGSLTLARPEAGLLSIQVPPGTPISCGDERVHLHGLSGKSVVVTLVQGQDAVARAIQVAEAESC